MEFGECYVGRHVVRAGRGSHQKDAGWIAAVACNIGAHPTHRRRRILRPARPSGLRREPIGHVDPNHAVARGPEGHIVVKRAASSILVAAIESAAVDINQNWPHTTDILCTKHIKQVALRWAIFDVADCFQARPRLQLMQRRVDGVGLRHRNHTAYSDKLLRYVWWHILRARGCADEYEWQTSDYNTEISAHEYPPSKPGLGWPFTRHSPFEH